MPQILNSIVPCTGCKACCINDLIVIHPECGDVVANYDVEPCAHPLTGKPAVALKHKANGECIYLAENGCSIHGRAPAICREYDCRKAFLALGSRNDRRRLVRAGFIDKSKLAEGRKRLNTLSGKVESNARAVNAGARLLLRDQGDRS